MKNQDSKKTNLSHARDNLTDDIQNYDLTDSEITDELQYDESDLISSMHEDLLSPYNEESSSKDLEHADSIQLIQPRNTDQEILNFFEKLKSKYPDQTVNCLVAGKTTIKFDDQHSLKYDSTSSREIIEFTFKADGDLEDKKYQIEKENRANSISIKEIDQETSSMKDVSDLQKTQIINYLNSLIKGDRAENHAIKSSSDDKVRANSSSDQSLSKDSSRLLSQDQLIEEFITKGLLSKKINYNIIYALNELNFTIYQETFTKKNKIIIVRNEDQLSG